MSIIDDDPRRAHRDYHWTDDYGWYRPRYFRDMLKWDKSLDDVDRKILTKLTERIDLHDRGRTVLKYGSIISITKQGWRHYRDIVINGKSLEDALAFSDRSKVDVSDRQ